MDDKITISQAARHKLQKHWGAEIVLQCCRYWLTHSIIGKPWGKCGICHQKPELISNSWDDYIGR